MTEPRQLGQQWVIAAGNEQRRQWGRGALDAREQGLGQFERCERRLSVTQGRIGKYQCTRISGLSRGLEIGPGAVARFDQAGRPVSQSRGN